MNTSLLRIATTLASIVSLAIAPPARAADCMNLGASPLSTTPIYGLGLAGSNSRSDCFAFSTDGGDLAITGMNKVEVAWIGNPVVSATLIHAAIDSLALRSADGLVIAPSHVQPHLETVVTPNEIVPYLAGNTWTFGELAPGVYQLNTRIGWSDGDGHGPYTLAIAAVPEPASAAMAALGLGLLASTLRRRALPTPRPRR